MTAMAMALVVFGGLLCLPLIGMLLNLLWDRLHRQPSSPRVYFYVALAFAAAGIPCVVLGFMLLASWGLG